MQLSLLSVWSSAVWFRLAREHLWNTRMKRQRLLALQDFQCYEVFMEVGIGSPEDKSLMQKSILLSKWGEHHQGCTWFLKVAQISYFTTFCLNSEIGTVDIHVHIKERRILLLLINVYTVLSVPTGKVLQICKTVLKVQQHSKKEQHVKKQRL